MRSLILSQCRDLRIGVTREDLGALTTVHARQFLLAVCFYRASSYVEPDIDTEILSVCLFIALRCCVKTAKGTAQPRSRIILVFLEPQKCDE